jgi:hypothetical protein
MRALAASYRRGSFSIFHGSTLSLATFKRPILATYWTNTMALKKRNTLQRYTKLHGACFRLVQANVSGRRSRGQPPAGVDESFFLSKLMLEVAVGEVTEILTIRAIARVPSFRLPPCLLSIRTTT